MALLREEIIKLIEESLYEFYCYILCYPDGTPFYVGKGKGFRLFNHETKHSLKNNPNKLLVNVIKKILNSNSKLTYTIEEYFNNESEAYSFEETLIQKYGRRDINTGILCNLDNGGQGGASDWSEETKNKRLITFKKRFKENPEYTRIWVDAQTTARINHPNMDKRTSETLKETYRTTNLAERLSKIHIKRNEDPKVKEDNSKAQTKKHKEDPDLRVKQGETRSKTFQDNPEIRKQIGQSRKQFNLNNPNKFQINQQNAIESARTPEARKKNSDAKINEYKIRKEIIDRCEKIIRENMIDINFLDKRKSVKEFKLFEKILTEKIK